MSLSLSALLAAPQTPHVSAAIIARVFLDPQLRCRCAGYPPPTPPHPDYVPVAAPAAAVPPLQRTTLCCRHCPHSFSPWAQNTLPGSWLDHARPSAALARPCRLFQYSPQRLLDSVPTMFAFPKLSEVFGTIASKIEATVRTGARGSVATVRPRTPAAASHTASPACRCAGVPDNLPVVSRPTGACLARGLLRRDLHLPSLRSALAAPAGTAANPSPCLL